ncbi:hypothetical protein SOPP22_19425 [Shewanella sp. OPT22]|nr:hypothetical protein SOPP22_19425 [Shewanella sp. OPT22]
MDVRLDLVGQDVPSEALGIYSIISETFGFVGPTWGGQRRVCWRTFLRADSVQHHNIKILPQFKLK